MNITIALGDWNSVFAVPCTVVDKHIKLAGSAQLKVLLWMLRHAGEEYTDDVLADALSMHQADVRDAMQYWIETGLLTAQGDTLLPGCARQEEHEESFTPQVAAPAVLPAKTRPLSRPQKPDNMFVAKRLSESDDLASMVQEAQVVLGKTISNGDCATLLMLHDDDGLPVDVILMLLQYAVSVGKTNMKYIEKVGISWAEEEINTHEKAEKKLRMLGQMQQAWRLVESVIGIDHRSPSTKESEAADRWVNQWSFSSAMIRLAYDHCVDRKGKYLPAYMDSILKRWHNEGIHSVAQAQEEKHGNSFSAETEKNSSYNIEEYERTSIFDEQNDKGTL